MPRYTVYPKTHYVTPRETILAAVDAIKVELKERLEQLHEMTRSWSSISACSSAPSSIWR